MKKSIVASILAISSFASVAAHADNLLTFQCEGIRPTITLSTGLNMAAAGGEYYKVVDSNHETDGKGLVVDSLRFQQWYKSDDSFGQQGFTFIVGKKNGQNYYFLDNGSDGKIGHTCQLIGVNH